MESGGLDWQTLPLQYRELQVFLRVLKDVEVRQDDVRCLCTLPPELISQGARISLRHFTRRDFELVLFVELENTSSKALDQLSITVLPLTQFHLFKYPTLTIHPSA